MDKPSDKLQKALRDLYDALDEIPVSERLGKCARFPVMTKAGVIRFVDAQWPLVEVVAHE